MSTRDDLADYLAGIFHNHATHRSLPDLGASVGVDITLEGDGGTKRERARSALGRLSERELAAVARWFGIRNGDVHLEKISLSILEKGGAPISEITRWDAARCFENDLCGEQDLMDLLGRLFRIGNLIEDAFFDGGGPAKQIWQHMVRNPDDYKI